MRHSLHVQIPLSTYVFIYTLILRMGELDKGSYSTPSLLYIGFYSFSRTKHSRFVCTLSTRCNGFSAGKKNRKRSWKYLHSLLFWSNQGLAGYGLIAKAFSLSFLSFFSKKTFTVLKIHYSFLHFMFLGFLGCGVWVHCRLGDYGSESL